MNLEVGSIIGDRYRLTRHIAAGGMGRVWEAHDDVLDRTVAVKVLHPQFSGDTEFVSRFRSEAKMTARVQHGNVAQVYDYGEISDDSTQPLSYLVMEFVRGEPLSEVLRRSPRLPEQHVLDVLEQTSRALQAAHGIGLVHRDVKPGNIMITPAGQVKLTDFGIAKAMGEAAVTQTGMIIGTAHYIAPEQAMGEDATPAGDVYSLAVVGYECLAGQRPFNADSPLAIAMAHVRDEAPDLPDDVSPHMRELIAYGMAKDPSQRYSDGAAFAAATASVRAGHEPNPPIGVVGDSATQTIRNTGLLGPAAGAGAAGLAAGAAMGAGTAAARDQGAAGTSRMPAPGTGGFPSRQPAPTTGQYGRQGPPTGGYPGPDTGSFGTAGYPSQAPQHGGQPAAEPERPKRGRGIGAGCIWGFLIALLVIAAAVAAVWWASSNLGKDSTPPPVTSTVQPTPSTTEEQPAETYVPPPETVTSTETPTSSEETTTSEEPSTPSSGQGTLPNPTSAPNPGDDLGNALDDLFNGGQNQQRGGAQAPAGGNNGYAGTPSESGRAAE